MNAAVKTRFFQFIKTVQCRYSAQSEGLLKIRKDGKVFVQRGNHDGNTTKIDREEIRNLMRGKREKPRSSKLDPVAKKDEGIGGVGYFLLTIPVSTFALGVWQVQRRYWKLSLLDDLKTRVNSPPVELPEDLSELETMEYRPVKVRGRFLHDKEILFGPRSLIIKGAGASESGGGIMTAGRSNSGFYIVTPFKLEDRDLTILVNRGWVPLEYRKNRKEAKTQTNDIVEVTGLVRLHENRPPFMPKNSPEAGKWYFRDLKTMSKTADTAPVFLELIASETVPGGPIAGQTRISLRNEHLSYIFTWFTLSAITGWMWHRLCIRKLPLL